MFGSSNSAIFIALQLTLCFFGVVNAAPLHARQALGAEPETITTTVNYQTDQGMMTETCIIMLTPLPDGTGNMQDIQSCSVAPAPAGASIGTQPSVQPPATAASAAPVSSAAAAPTSAAISAPVSSSAVSTEPAAAAAPSAAPIASSAAAPDPSVAASASVSAAASSGSALADNSPTAPANNAAGAPAATGTAAADTAVTTLPPFPIPGRAILIPPIGLGIFCGVTGIGILVFSFVTWERTRYRKTFRKRKLAEAGAAMGYGGMAKV